MAKCSLVTSNRPCQAETFGPSRQTAENELFLRPASGIQSNLRPSPRDGFFTLNDAPGFGVEIDEQLLDAYTVEHL